MGTQVRLSSDGKPVDPAFRAISSTTRAAFYVWRIEGMKLVPVPKEKIGQFFKGDSYLIFSLTASGQSPRGLGVQAREIKGSRAEQHIHFWLGNDTSPDEAGVAAYKAVELDDLLGGAPVQHREVEGSESELFMSYFTKGIKTVEGGHKSGFNHVDNTFQIRLYQVKGKRNLRISQIAISWDSMNHGDAYILDLGTVIFVWEGKDCSKKEKFKALEHSRHLKDDRKPGVIIVCVIDGEEDKMTNDEKKLFEQHLPLNQKSAVKATEAVAADAAFEKKRAGETKLFWCREEEGNLTIKEVKTGPFSRKDLSSDDSYIIDLGPECIWVWIGKNASKSEKNEAMRNAVGFIQKKGYPNETPVIRVVDGGEPVDFKCIFQDWPQPPPPGKVYCRSNIAKTVQTKFDAKTLHQNKALAAESQMFDDGTGTVEVWQVVDFDLVPVDKHTYGDFYAGDSYVIKYTYQVNRKDNFLIYYWQGGKSTADEKGTAALKAVEMDDALGGAAVQIRVVQNKEPPHFMAMFDGKMVIFAGGKAGWQKGDRDQGPGDKYMLQVRGTSELNSKAIQVDLTAESLNSNDVFVIFTKSSVYIWFGKGSTGDEREYAKKIASRSAKSPVCITEGYEKEDFWNVLGGKKPYASDKKLQVESSHPPRLYQLSNASGRFRVEKIEDFVQDDLVPEDIMILDVWDAVYLWIGIGSRQDEKKEAERIAREYLETDPAGRDPDTPIYKVKQGLEPPTFSGFFGVWDNDLWSKGKTYEQMKAELGAEAVKLSLVQEAINGNNVNFNEVNKYAYSELAVPVEELPEGVNPENREIHLSTEEFQKHFKCTYESFSKKPIWKQQQIKKNLRLF